MCKEETWNHQREINKVQNRSNVGACVNCDKLTGNMVEEEWMCDDCEREYWFHMADEHSGCYDEE